MSRYMNIYWTLTRCDAFATGPGDTKELRTSVDRKVGAAGRHAWSSKDKPHILPAGRDIASEINVQRSAGDREH